MEISLTDRQQHILWATVKHYITTAEPVGSKVLAEEYKLSVSPATIRNAMGFLEKAGLLYQPHTSAGRVPSDSGYRIYVDQLIKPADTLARQVDNVLREKLNSEARSFEVLLRGAAQILSTLSGYITLITMPQKATSQLRYIQLVQIDPGRVMLIVVTDAYETQSFLMELTVIPDDVTPDPEMIDRELQILSNFLNNHLRGSSIGDLLHLDWNELDRQFQRYADSLKTLLNDLNCKLQAPTYTHILISGIAEVLRQPEFAELNQIQTIIQLLEEQQEQLWPLFFDRPDKKGFGINEKTSGKRVNVWIGSENPLEPIRNCSLISSTYQRGSVPVGSVGVLGPTRMVYENVIAVVEAAADYLSEALS